MKNPLLFGQMLILMLAASSFAQNPQPASAIPFDLANRIYLHGSVNGRHDDAQPHVAGEEDKQEIARSPTGPNPRRLRATLSSA